LGGTFNPNPKLYGLYAVRCIERKTLNPKKPLSYYTQRKNLLGGTFNPNPKAYRACVVRPFHQPTIEAEIL